jgi:hypothetical protein
MARRRYRWAARDTWVALFWAGVGFLGGVWYASGGMIWR